MTEQTWKDINTCLEKIMDICEKDEDGVVDSDEAQFMETLSVICEISEGHVEQDSDILKDF